MRRIDNEYQLAFRIPSVLDLLLFRKKLTVTGTNGNTHGVTTAKNPVTRQTKKVDHSPPSSCTGALPFIAACTEAGLIFIEKLSSPVGYSSPDFPSHVTVPLIFTLSVAGIFRSCLHSTLSVKYCTSALFA